MARLTAASEALDRLTFRTLFESVPDPILICDDERVYVDANPAACRLLGLTCEELLVRRIDDVVSPGLDVSAVWQSFLEAGTIAGECSVRRADGEPRVVAFHARARIAPGLHLSVLRDVTETRAAEQKISLLASRLSAVLNSTTDCVYCLDREGRFTYMNDRAAQRLANGRSLVGLNALEAFPSARNSEVEKEYSEALRSQKARCFETFFDPLQGWFEVHVFPAADGLTVFFRDITESKRLEEQLSAERERIDLVLRANHDGIMDVDLRTGKVLLSGRWSELFGVSAQDIPRTAAELGERVHPEDMPNLVAEVSNHCSKRTSHYEVAFRMKDGRGTYRWVRGRGQAVWDAAGNAIRLVGSHSDITARKKAEEKLKANERRFRSLIENALDVIAIVDRTGIIQYQSPSFLNLLGYQYGDLHCRSAFDYIHPDDCGRAGSALAEVTARPGATASVEGRFRHKNKSWRVLEAALTNLLHDKDVCGIVVNARDVTERHRAEEQLRESEARLSLAQTAANVGSWEWDIGAGVWRCSSECLRMHEALPQYAAADGARWRTLITPPHTAFTEYARKALRGEEQKAGECEYSVRVPDGQTRWIRTQGKLISDASGMPVRMLGVSMDVTDRRRQEDQLRTSESRLAEAQAIAQVGNWEHDLRTGHVHWSAETYRIVGIDPGKRLTADVMLARVHPEDRAMVSRTILSSIGKKAPCNIEFRVQRPDGRIRLVLVQGRVICDESGPVRQVGVLQDLTERKQLEEQLRQAQKMEAAGQIAGGVAHDFNNLLTIILGYANLVYRKLEEGSPLRARVAEIRNAGERAAALTRQLLAFSRKQILHPVALDLNAAIRAIETMLVRVVGEDIRVVLCLDPCVGSIKADPTQIDQVLINLVVNARDAMPNGGEVSIATAMVDVPDAQADSARLSEGRYVMLTVADVGTGMDAVTQSKVFEPFFTTKEQGKGTGLGLSTVHGIVEQSGGKICLASKPGQGTTFRIYFPACGQIGGHG